MPLFYCCPCLNVRISCRSVSNNLPPFATEMAVARRAFEQGDGGGRSVASMSAAGAGAPKRTPSAIAKLSVAGVSTEHAKLVRSTPVRARRSRNGRRPPAGPACGCVADSDQREICQTRRR